MGRADTPPQLRRSEEHTSELQSHSFISYAVFCLKKRIADDADDAVWRVPHNLCRNVFHVPVFGFNFFLMIRRPPRPTPFPYPTLFRSMQMAVIEAARHLARLPGAGSSEFGPCSH